MFYKVAMLIAITFIPALELRASIPVGIYKYSITWPVVFVVCTLANIAVGLAWFWALAHLVPLVTRIKPLGYVYNKYVERTQKRIDKAVGKWGEWAVAEGWPESVVRIEAEKFRDFWTAKAGRDAAKLDWQATWRNWMRNSKSPKAINGGKNGEPTDATDRLRRVVTAAARGSSAQDWG